MTTIIKATYVQGVFRPLQPIALAEGTQVELALAVPPEEPRAARLIREAAESHPAVVASWERFLESLGVHGEPIGDRVQSDAAQPRTGGHSLCGQTLALLR